MIKFTDIEKNVDYEILTPSGFVNFSRVMRTIFYRVWEIKLANNMTIRCADNHRLIGSDNNTDFAKDQKVGNLIQTKEGVSEIVSIRETDNYEQMYDLELCDKDHVYYTNGILSHNTTTVSSFILYYVVFNADVQAAILANKADTAREILERIKLMYENLPVFLQPGITEWNKGSINLGNNSKILCAATSSSSIRGRSINFLYLDEFAHIQNDVEFFTSTYPVISSGKTTKTIITSTPKGMNLFYKIYIDAVEGRNTFFPLKFIWKDHPHRDDEWMRKMISNTGPELFEQEYNGEFLGSSGTLISGHKLKHLVHKDPIYQQAHTKIYINPIQEHEYVGCVDISEGVGKDYSVITIIDVTTKPFQQVLVFRDNHTVPVAMIDILNRILIQYNNAFCVIESNGVGKIVADGLFFDVGYDNVMITKNVDGFATQSIHSTQIGLRQTKKTKINGCSSLKVLIESDILQINDRDTILELFSFIRVGNSYEAEKKHNDDIVMTLVIFAWLSDQPIFDELAGGEGIVKDAIKKYVDETTDNNLLFGYFDDGTESVFTDETYF